MNDNEQKLNQAEETPDGSMTSLEHGRQTFSHLSNSKKRAMLGLVCIIGACVVGFGGVALVNRVSLSTTPVVRAKTEIPAGTKITSDMVEVDEVSKYSLQGNTTGDASLVIGAYATVEILPQDNITGNKLSKTNPAYALQDGEMLVSVPVKNLSDALAGQLKAGDIVRISGQKSTGSTSGSNNAGGSTSSDNLPVELEYVKVAGVYTSTGTSTTQQNNQTTSRIGTTTTSSGSTSGLPASVTLYVNDKQLSRLSQLSQTELSFALVYRGGGSEAETLLQKQQALLQGVQ